VVINKNEGVFMKKVLSLFLLMGLSTSVTALAETSIKCEGSIACVVSSPTLTVTAIVGAVLSSPTVTTNAAAHKEAIVIAKDDANDYLQNPGSQPSATLVTAFSALEKTAGSEAAALSEQDKALAVSMIAEEISNTEKQ
ncbi:MAG: hypothetical protein ACOYOK_16005, partial [Pseudobdellovibrionaceae bacterium]